MNKMNQILVNNSTKAIICHKKIAILWQNIKLWVLTALTRLCMTVVPFLDLHFF